MIHKFLVNLEYLGENFASNQCIWSKNSTSNGDDLRIFGCLMQQWPRHVHNPCVGSERVTSPTRNTDTSPFEVLLMRRFSGIFEVTNLTSCEPFKNCQDFAGSGVSMRRIDAPWCVVNAGHGDARSVEPWRQCYIHSWWHLSLQRLMCCQQCEALKLKSLARTMLVFAG